MIISEKLSSSSDPDSWFSQ